MKKITLISAAEFEAKPTFDLLTKEGIEVEYLDIGIGPLNAAKKSSHLLKVLEGKDVVFLGTCGVFGGFRELEFVTPRTVRWLPACERNQLSEPIENIFPIYNTEPVPGIKQVDVICTSHISFDPKLDPAYEPHSTVENLELYSVLPEILESSKSFKAILAVTNEICADSRTQWKANFKKAAEKSASVVLTLVK